MEIKSVSSNTATLSIENIKPYLSFDSNQIGHIFEIKVTINDEEENCYVLRWLERTNRPYWNKSEGNEKASHKVDCFYDLAYEIEGNKTFYPLSKPYYNQSIRPFIINLGQEGSLVFENWSDAQPCTYEKKNIEIIMKDPPGIIVQGGDRSLDFIIAVDKFQKVEIGQNKYQAQYVEKLVVYMKQIINVKGKKIGFYSCSPRILTHDTLPVRPLDFNTLIKNEATIKCEHDFGEVEKVDVSQFVATKKIK